MGKFREILGPWAMFSFGVSVTNGSPPDLNYIRIVASKVDDNKSMQKELLDRMRQVFRLAINRTPLKHFAEIDNVPTRLMTVDEVNGPMTSKADRDRCLTYLCGANVEVAGRPIHLAQSYGTAAHGGRHAPTKIKNCTGAISAAGSVVTTSGGWPMARIDARKRKEVTLTLLLAGRGGNGAARPP